MTITMTMTMTMTIAVVAAAIALFNSHMYPWILQSRRRLVLAGLSGSGVAGTLDAASLAGTHSLAGLSAETQRAYLLELQRQRAAAAAAASGQRGAASHQLLLQQQEAQAAQMLRAPTSASVCTLLSCGTLHR